MANTIRMVHQNTGIHCDAYEGFSWTTLFFGFVPAVIRGDLYGAAIGFIVFLVCFSALASVIPAFLWVAWAFLYNANHMTRLVERGYVEKARYDLWVNEPDYTKQ